MKPMINVHINAEQGEGPELNKRFNVHGFPTLLVIDSSGEEIDRFVGYRPPETFIKEVDRILSGEGTIPALRKKIETSPDDLDAAVALGTKLAVAKPDSVVSYYDALAQKV